MTPRIVGFASGSPLSERVMETLSRRGRLAAIVLPDEAFTWRATLSRRMGRGWGRFERFGTPLASADEIKRHAPDVIVVASFPRVLPRSIFGCARMAAINVHMSLLPRHRGADPIFGTYWADDREAGVTLHHMNERADAGEIISQAAIDLPRAQPSRVLYERLVAKSVDLLEDFANRLEHGLPRGLAQDERGATHWTSRAIAAARVPIREWPAERVWHVLSGLGDQRSTLLEDAEGRLIPHGPAISYEARDDLAPGKIRVDRERVEVHCQDGVVAVAPPLTR